MKIIRRWIYGQVLQTVAYITLGFLALFFFMDSSDTLAQVSPTFGWGRALVVAVLALPAHGYELLPMTVLMGAVWVMTRLALSSQYTVLRVSGLSPLRALTHWLGLGLGLALLTFVLGDYVAPPAHRLAQVLQGQRLAQGSQGDMHGAWLKEKQADGHSYIVHVGTWDVGAGRLYDIRLFDWDAQGHLVTLTHAQEGQWETGGSPFEWATVSQNSTYVQGWQLKEVQQVHLAVQPQSMLVYQSQKNWIWRTQITPDMLLAALKNPDQMSAWNLWRYANYLQANVQRAQPYEIAFWKKLFYPFSCLVMMCLAMPFAYLQRRQNSAMTYVLAGVVTGLGFFLLNQVSPYVGQLQNWPAWVAAGAPSFLYIGISLGVLIWFIARR